MAGNGVMQPDRDEAAPGERSILASLPAPICVLDADGTILEVSAAWERFARENGGLPERTGLGANYLAVCARAEGEAAEFARAAACGIAAVLAGSRAEFALEYPCDSPTRRRWFLLQATPRLGGHGGAVVAHTDITDRKLAEEALRESQQRLQAALEAADVGTWQVDLRTDQVTRGANLNRLLGLDPVASTVPIADYFDRRVHPEDRAAALGAWRRALASGASYDVENRIVRPDGAVRWVRDRGRILPGPDGRPLSATGAVVDITERKLAEIALRASEERFRRTFENAAVGMVLADPAGRWLRVNEKYCEIVGYTREELFAKSWRDITHPDDLEADLSNFGRLLAGAIPMFGLQKRYIRKDGAHVWVNLTVSLVRDERGQPDYLIAIVEDITERKEAERRLQVSEERLRAIVETAVDGIVTLDVRGTILSFNPAAERMFGSAAAEVLGGPADHLLPSPYREWYRQVLAQYHATGVPQLVGTVRELVGRRRDGTTFPIEVSVSEVDELGLITSIVRDISERRALQEELLTIAEREQRRIGQDLHDDVGQELTGVGLMVEALVGALEEAGSPEAALAARVRARLESIRRGVRTLSQGLVPVEVDAQGLMAALDELAARVRADRAIACTFACRESVPIEDNRVATHLYRITQEAIANAIRHGQAPRIDIHLAERGGIITLEVRDHGVGLPAGPGRGDGMGLKIMRYRADQIGGTLEVAPADGGGTRVVCTIPGGPVHVRRDAAGPRPPGPGPDRR